MHDKHTKYQPVSQEGGLMQDHLFWQSPLGSARRQKDFELRASEVKEVSVPNQQSYSLILNKQEKETLKREMMISSSDESEDKQEQLPFHNLVKNRKESKETALKSKTSGDLRHLAIKYSQTSKMPAQSNLDIREPKVRHSRSEVVDESEPKRANTQSLQQESSLLSQLSSYFDLSLGTAAVSAVTSYFGGSQTQPATSDSAPQISQQIKPLGVTKKCRSNLESQRVE